MVHRLSEGLGTWPHDLCRKGRSKFRSAVLLGRTSLDVRPHSHLSIQECGQKCMFLPAFLETHGKASKLALCLWWHYFMMAPKTCIIAPCFVGQQNVLGSVPKRKDTWATMMCLLHVWQLVRVNGLPFVVVWKMCQQMLQKDASYCSGVNAALKLPCAKLCTLKY